MRVEHTKDCWGRAVLEQVSDCLQVVAWRRDPGCGTCMSMDENVEHVFLPPEVTANAEEYRKSLERILKFYTSYFRRAAERQ